MFFLLGPTLTPMKNKKEYFGIKKIITENQPKQQAFLKNIIKTSFKISIWNIHV